MKMIKPVSRVRVELDAARWCEALSQVCFALTLIALPLRFRLVLMHREFPPIYADYTDVLLFSSDWFFLGTLLFWGLSLALRPRRIELGPWFLTYPLMGVTVTGLLSVIKSIDPLLSTYHAGRLVLLLGFYLFVINQIRSLSQLALPLLVQVFIQALVGIGQVLQQGDLGLQTLGEYELDPDWNGVSVVFSSGVRLLRAYGLTDHPNLLGGILAFGLILLAAWYMSTRSRWDSIYAAFFTAGALGLLVTFSRSAWLAFAAGSALAAWLVWRKRDHGLLLRLLSLWAASLIVLLPFVVAYAPVLGVRLNRGSSFAENPQEMQSLGSRPLLNNAANEIFAENAVSGTGLGTFPLALRGRYPVFPVDYQPAHFVLLDVAAETGIFGALFYALLSAAPWLDLWLNRRRLHFGPALVGASGLLLAVTLVGFFDYYTWLLVPGRLWQWLAWGLWGMAYLSALRGQSHA
mgnify:FL=1